MPALLVAPGVAGAAAQNSRTCWLLWYCAVQNHAQALTETRVTHEHESQPRGLQAVPLYLSEMAPAKRRGAVTMTFHLGAAFGLLSAQITNYFTAQISSHDNAYGCGSYAGSGRCSGSLADVSWVACRLTVDRGDQHRCLLSAMAEAA